MTNKVQHRIGRSEWVAALAAGVLILVATLLLVSSAVAQEQTGDPSKWRNYWTQLYPVFTHPRCLNCHGVVNPFTGENHDGGQIEDGEMCFGCHTANTAVVAGECTGEGFTTTPDDGVGDLQLSRCAVGDQRGRIRVPVGPTWGGLGPDFVDGETHQPKDMRTICRMIKKELAPAALLHHVREDFLIGVAFEGTRAMEGIEPDPPSMGRGEFAALLERWITEAAMACGTEGKLTLTDNVTLDSPRSPYGKTQVRNAIEANVAIKLDVATADLRYDEISTFLFTPKTPGCSPVSTGTAAFTAEGKPETNYEIRIGPNRAYRMRFLLGPVPGKTEFSYVEMLCRPPRAGGDASLEPATDLRFGLDEWHTALPPPAEDVNLLVLRGTTTIPNDNLGAFGFVSGGERKITWDITIE